MSKVSDQIAPATLWPEFKWSMDAVIRQLIYEHSIKAVMEARHQGSRIPWEKRIGLWANFCAVFPTIKVDHEDYLAVFREEHAPLPTGHCNTPSAR